MQLQKPRPGFQPRQGQRLGQEGPEKRFMTNQGGIQPPPLYF